MKLLFFIIFISTIVMAGTESGGGGGGVVVLRNGTPILLDFLNIDPEFDDHSSQNAIRRLPISSSYTIEIEPDSVKDIRAAQPAFDLALSTLEQWMSLNFDFAGYWIRSSFFKPVIWEFTFDKIEATPFISPGLLISDRMETAGYYKTSDQRYMIRIFIPLWNRMGIFSQAGLLIHESLRHVQIGHFQGFNELNLQQATAIIMMCKPTDRLGYYIRYLILNGSSVAEKIYGRFDEVVRAECRRNF